MYMNENVAHDKIIISFSYIYLCSCE